MMKIPPILAFLLLCAPGAFATVTLQFGTTTTYASNWANGAGAGGSTLVWGIIIDADGDGFDFDFSGYRPGVSVVAGAHNLTMGVSGLPSDDILYISPALMTLTTNTNDGAQLAMNRITGIANMAMTGNVGTGDHFAIVWFDRTGLGGGDTQLGEKFGTFGNALFTLPAESATQPYIAAFTGPESLKPMTFSFGIGPEPSSLLLGLLGGLGFLRRRR